MLATVGLAVVGGGLIGAYHAESIARRIPDVALVGVADPVAGRAASLCSRLGGRGVTDWADLLADPAVQGIVIATPTPYHTELIVAAAHNHKAIFCEKPIANTLAEADRAIAAAASAGVPLQIGFQRRFDRAYQHARAAVMAGELGSIQLLRSVTRDPSFDDPTTVPPWAVFRETLIHDFDVMRFLAGGAEPVEVSAMADALLFPDWKRRGLLDTAVVTVRFDNGALATADASFQAVYGYDVRAEVFGSAGMISIGDDSATRAVQRDAHGAHRVLIQSFIDLFGAAYTAELASFAACIREGTGPACSGEDGRAALVTALAAIRSVEERRAVSVAEVR